MISEIFGLLDSVETRGKGTNRKFRLNLNQNRIRSISAYSSNSIFYFPTIVSDQCTPEEIAMISRMIEKAYASFVVACISLMPFHRISADDKESVEEYLKQFHQNLGMEMGSGQVTNKFLGYVNSMEESTDEKAFEQLQNIMLECWHKSLAENTDFVKLVANEVSLNEMYNIDPIDPKTRILQERYALVQDELNTWGFLGEATDDMAESDDSVAEMSDEEIERSMDQEYPDKVDLDPPVIDPNDDPTKSVMNTPEDPLDEGAVKSAIDNIKFSLESVSANKIMSCQSLTKLSSLESKLNKLKNKYTKYLNRYKRKYNENKKKGTHSKLSIRFNNMVIGDPKAFMKHYGTYIKLINKRLKLVEKRRAELRKRKGLPAESEGKMEESIISLSQMDLDAVDYCDRVITESLQSSDESIFILTEADISHDTVPKSQYDQLVREKERSMKMGQNYLDQARQKNKELDKERRRSNVNSQRAARYQKENDQLRGQLKDAEKQLRNAQRNQNKNADQKPSEQKPGSDMDTDFGGPRSGYVPGSARVRRDHETFDSKAVFTDMDMKKANEAIPIFSKANIGFIVDGTEEVVNRDVLVGVKAYIHKAPAAELVNDIYNCIINKRKFLKFVKFVTGEERSLSDLLFGIKELRADALDARNGAGEWRSAFKQRRRWAKMSVPYLMKEYTPNGTLVITMNEVEFIKEQYGIDVMKPDHVKMIMDADFLLGFVVIDQSEEMVYVTYDGHGYGFQQYTYAMLERENNQTDRLMREMYRSFNR